MKKTWLAKIFLALSLALLMVVSLASCDIFKPSFEGEGTEPEENTADDVSENESDDVAESDSNTVTDVTDEEDTSADTEESETQGADAPTCVHNYTANITGHWKPACEVCGKPSGSPQTHEYEQKLEDEGDAWLYIFRCKICKFAAYELSVPYSINSFYSAGELAGIDTNKTFSSDFAFDAGTGYAGFTMSGGGSGTIKVVESEDTDLESGRYAVMKVRLPSSQTGFTVTIRSVGTEGSFSMAFTDFNPGWSTIVVDMTTAVGEDKNGNKTGYVQNSSEEYYLGYFGINGRVVSGEHFDVSYVMFCDTLDEALAFTDDDMQLYIYTNIATGERTEVVKPCVDENGNLIEHKITSDENGHTVEEPCYQCGLAAVKNEPHVFAQVRVDGKLTYACSVCHYLQYGDYVNKYFSSEQIFKNGVTYYKVDKSLLTEDETEFTRFTGRGTTAQVIYARNNYASSDAEESAAFPVGEGNLLIVRMRTNSPDVTFRILVGAAAGKEKEVIFPTRLATVVSEPDAEAEEYGWTTYIIDLPRAVPSVYLADENGEYKIHNFYFQMGTNKGEDYTADVYYDIDFVAFVDTWSEVKTLVPDETVVKVNATNDGTIVKTKEQECVGEHSWGENADGNVYSYLCVNCGTPLKIVNLDKSVTKYISGFEVARNAAVYALSGTKEVLVEGDDTIFGRVSNHSEIWWSRHQQDYSYGTTGGALDNKLMDVGQAKYFVVRFRTSNTAKNLEFYISTTGKNGTPRTEEEVTDKKPITVPTSSGSIVFSTPAAASVAGEWTTYVFELEKLLPEYYVRDPETGSYIIDTFGIAYSKDYNADIEFMAFVEGGWAEIDALTPDETVVYVTHYKNKTYSIMETATGKCADGQHSYLYTGTANADGSTTYTYACGGCGDLIYSKDVSTAVTKFISGNEVAFGASLYAASGTKQIGVDENGVFYGRVSDHSEIWWSRHQQDFYGLTGDVLNNKFYDVGEAKYFVIRFRTDNTAKGFEFYLSTTGKNGTPRTEDEVTENRPIYVPTTNGYTSFATPVSTAAKANEWITYVFNLEDIYSEYYVKDPETGHYIIDTFAIAYGKGYNADVEFMAFVDGDWSDVAALTPDESVVYVTHYRNKTFAVLDTATGSCAECQFVYNNVTNSDGSVTYKYSCTGCGKVEASHTVAADVNQYYTLDKMGKYGATDNGIKAEDGVLYRSYNFASSGHIFVNGTNAYTAIEGDTGAYLVIKYRSSNDQNVVFETATADKNVVVSWESSTTPSVDGDPSLYIYPSNAATEWRVMVIYLDGFNYTQNSTENVQVRISTSAASIDVSYVAIVDDESEARNLIDGELDATYVYYASKSAAPVVKMTADGTVKN